MFNSMLLLTRFSSRQAEWRVAYGIYNMLSRQHATERSLSI